MKGSLRLAEPIPCRVECIVRKVSLRSTASLTPRQISGIAALAWFAPQSHQELCVEIAPADSAASAKRTDLFIKSTPEAPGEQLWVCRSSLRQGRTRSITESEKDSMVFDVNTSSALVVRILARTVAWMQAEDPFQVFAEVNFKIDEDVVPALLADGDLCLPLVHKGHVKGKAWLNVSLDARDGSKMPWSQGSQPVVLRGAHRDGLTSCAIFPSGDRVVTVSHDGSGCVWNTKGMQSAEQVALMPGHTDTITSCKVFPSGDSIITTSLDDTCILWSSSGKQMKSIYVVGFLAVFPNGERVHLGSDNKNDEIWSTLGEQLPVRCGHTDSITACSVFPSGEEILTVAGDGIGIIWSLAGEPLVRLEGHLGGITSCDVFPDGGHVLTVSKDRSGIIWTAAGAQETALHAHTDVVTCCAIFPSGDRILTGSLDTTAIIWKVSGHVLSVLHGHTQAINACAVFPSCDHVLTGSQDCTGIVWSMTSGGVAAVLRGHTQGITACSVWDSGKRVLTVSDDRTGMIWQVSLVNNWHDMA